MDIAGVWKSYYEFGQGPDNTPLSSEHLITFQPTAGDGWFGMSEPNREGSHVVMSLLECGSDGDSTEFIGDWREHTAPEGDYGGRVFTGAVVLILKTRENKMAGLWTGANSGKTEVKVGRWILDRVIDEPEQAAAPVVS